MALYSIAGLTTKVESNVPITVDLIPVGQTNQRPGYKLHQPPNWIQHETGNADSGAGAKFHRDFLFNGAPDNEGVSQELSYHFTVDDHSIYQMIPIDEMTWQAADGSGPGNYQCISCELCVNRDGNETKARHNAEALCGAILKVLGRPASAIGRHWDYNYGNAPALRHHCPDHMMNDGYWPTFVANAAKIITGGETVPIGSIVYAPGVDSDLCRKWFKGVTGGDGNWYAFDPNGPVSKVWLDQCLATGEWPALAAVDVYNDSAVQVRRYFRFSNGLIVFVTTGETPRILKAA